MNEPKTTTELISELLKAYPESEWDRKILPVAIQWNNQAYKLPEELIKSMYRSLSAVQKKLNEEARNLRPYEFHKS